MKLISHQGTRIFAPENSIPGYEIAAKMGYYALNFAQVRSSKDNTLYVMHDPTLDRTTNGTGLISEKTDAEIAQLSLDLQESYAEYDINSFTKEQLHVPTLEEGIQICKKYNIVPMIRLGIEPKESRKAYANLFSLIDKYKIDKNFILSGSVTSMNYLDKYFPDTEKVIFSHTADVQEMINLFDKYTWTRKKTVLAMLRSTKLTKEEIQKLNTAGYGAYSSNPGDIRNPQEAKKEFARLAADGCSYANAERFTEIRF